MKKTNFNKEIFIVNPKTYKTAVLQYTNKKLFMRMLEKIKRWERIGRDVHILDVRDSIYGT